MGFQTWNGKTLSGWNTMTYLLFFRQLIHSIYPSVNLLWQLWQWLVQCGMTTFNIHLYNIFNMHCTNSSKMFASINKQWGLYYRYLLGLSWEVAQVNPCTIMRSSSICNSMGNWTSLSLIELEPLRKNTWPIKHHTFWII